MPPHFANPFFRLTGFRLPIFIGHAAGELMSFADGRARIILVIIASLLVGMIGRVAYLQTYGRQKTIRWAERQQHTAIKSIARRGTILSRNGYPMAATVQTTSLYVDPTFL